MSAERTPGPWVLEDDGSIEHEDGGGIAIVHPNASVRTSMRYGEDFNHANGRLIAASPDLLAACESALPWIAIATADCGQHPQAIANAKADLLKLQLAVAKAGGNPGRGIDEAARAALAAVEVKP